MNSVSYEFAPNFTNVETKKITTKASNKVRIK